MVGDIGIFQFIGICIGSDDLCKGAPLQVVGNYSLYMAGCLEQLSGSEAARRCLLGVESG